jgi:hypothetical protein
MVNATATNGVAKAQALDGPARFSNVIMRTPLVFSE